VNLQATRRTLNVERVDASKGTKTPRGTISRGSAKHSFTPRFRDDDVPYIVDAAGHH
jgi:hypothetical protein